VTAKASKASLSVIWRSRGQQGPTYNLLTMKNIPSKGFRHQSVKLWNSKWEMLRWLNCNLEHSQNRRYRLLSCSSVWHQLDSWSVFAYPKQRATVLVGSVLKWRARPQCLHRQLKSLRVSKKESYGLSRICFEMTRQATMPSSKAWLCLADEQHK
jgi:hypothetical protein